MTLDGIMLNEISQTEKDKYCMISPVESEKAKFVETEQNELQALGLGEIGQCWSKRRNFQLEAEEVLEVQHLTIP